MLVLDYALVMDDDAPFVRTARRRKPLPPLVGLAVVACLVCFIATCTAMFIAVTKSQDAAAAQRRAVEAERLVESGRSAGGVVQPAVTEAKKPPAPPVSTRSSLVGVSPDREGETWSPDELSRFVVRAGVKVRFEGGLPGIIGPPSFWLIPLDARSEGTGLSRYDKTASVEVFKFATAQDAKDRAGVWNGAWHWGRFYFRPTSTGVSTLEAVKRALAG